MASYINIIPAIRSIRGVNSFTYVTEEELSVGEIVWIPWRNKTVFGVVSAVDVAKPKFQTKAVESTTSVIVSQQYLAFMRWFAEYYFISLSHAVRSCLPEPMKRSSSSVPDTGEYEPARLAASTVPAIQHIVKIAQQDASLTVSYTSINQVSAVISGLLKTTAERIAVVVPEERLLPVLQKHLHPHHPVVIHGKSSKSALNNCLTALTTPGSEHLFIGTKRLSLLPIMQCDRIIVVDPGDTAHKQWELNPRFHVWSVIQQYGALTSCAVLAFQQAPTVLPGALEVDTAITDAMDNHVTLVEVSEETGSEFKGLIALSVWDKVKNAKCPVLWFNRKGRSRYTTCKTCRAFVGDTAANTCSNCGGTDLQLRGFGTGSVVDMISAQTDRPVIELTKEAVESGVEIPYQNNPIIIATSIVHSAVDWRWVDYAAVLSVDSQLAIPQVRSQEHMLYELSKLRNSVPQLDIQTFSPEHTVIQAITSLFSKQWLAKENELRKTLQVPPYSSTALVRTELHAEPVERELAELVDVPTEWIIDREL